tara:strand:+ start:2220 stop:3491 length:1272 start_codon:yes stop_codon:yes gene_type:complete
LIKEVSVLPHQRLFIKSTASSTGLVAGFGAGKSYAGTLKTLIKKMLYPSVKVAYYLPTYPHIRDIAFEKFPEMCEELGLQYQLHRTDKELNIEGFGTVIFRNMSEPEYIIGYEVGYSLIDECDILPKTKMDKAFKQILARNRSVLPNKDKNQVDVVGTPEGYRWFYDRFVTNKTDDYSLIKAKTMDNPYLPDDYIDTLKGDYDERLLKQYLNGEFINVNGSAVYHQFDRTIHVIDDIEVNPSLPIYLSFDFNINPYNAIYLIQEINDKVIIIDNAILNKKPLVDSLKYLKEKFSYLGNALYSATVYGDASGRARSQGTAQTNYELIRNAGFHHHLIKTANPRVADRVNIVNSLLMNGDGDAKLAICKRNSQLITDFEKMSYNDKGEVDKTDSELTHNADSIGYYVEYTHSLTKPKELRARYST